MRSWPLALPTPSRESYQLAPMEQCLRTDFEAGYRRLRRISAARRDSASVQWRFTDAEFRAFRAWHGDEPWSLAGDSDTLSGWTTVNATVVPDGLVGPDRELATRLRDSTDPANHYVQRQLTAAGPGSLWCHALLRSAGRTRARLVLVDRADALRHADIDLAAGTVTSQGGLDAVAVLRRSGGWWSTSITCDSGTGASVPRLRIHILSDSGVPSYAGDGVNGIGVCGVCARDRDGYDLPLRTGSDGRVLGAAGGSAWVEMPMAFGGGLSRVEARFEGPWQAQALSGLHWQVTARMEVRNA